MGCDKIFNGIQLETYIPSSSKEEIENSGLLESPWMSLSFTSTSY